MIENPLTRREDAAQLRWFSDDRARLKRSLDVIYSILKKEKDRSLNVSFLCNLEHATE